MSSTTNLLTRLAPVYRGLRWFCAHRAARLSFFLTIALIARWPLLSTAGALTDFRDAEYLTLFEESARITVVKFHQIPLWDPYYCGGIPALSTPSAHFASPTFLLTLLFGTLRAESLIAFAMTVVGLEGAFAYARARGATSLGATFAAPDLRVVRALCGRGLDELLRVRVGAVGHLRRAQGARRECAGRRGGRPHPRVDRGARRDVCRAARDAPMAWPRPSRRSARACERRGRCTPCWAWAL